MKSLIQQPLLYITLLVYTTACATTEKYEAKLASWVGKSEKSLVQAWGAPDSVYELSRDEKILTYQSARNVFFPGSAPSYQTNFVGNTAYTNAYGGSPSMNVSMSCKTSFTIEKKKVISWSWKGNDCRAN